MFVPDVFGEVVLGFDVCGFVPDGLLCVCAGAELEVVLVLGVVLWATTQVPDSSNKENSVALGFMQSRASYDLVTSRTLDAIMRRGESSRLPRL